jgi:hypothetical protein
MDVDDEPFVFRLLAYSLVRHLNLRLDCADAVFFELFGERVLVRAWLDRRAPLGTLSGALAAAAAAAHGA